MFSIFSIFKKSPSCHQTGFTVIELLVSISILVLILTVVLTRQQSFDSAVLLRSQAYELALSIREMQLSAVSSENTVTASGDEFRSVLGVHFDSNAANNHRYVFFIDDGVRAKRYDSGDTLNGAIGILDPRFEIRDIRYHNGSVIDRNNVSITYERPNFDASFRSNPGVLETTGSYQIDIGLAGGSGSVCPDDVRTIEVTSTGQVTVLQC